MNIQEKFKKLGYYVVYEDGNQIIYHKFSDIYLNFMMTKYGVRLEFNQKIDNFKLSKELLDLIQEQLNEFDSKE